VSEMLINSDLMSRAWCLWPKSYIRSYLYISYLSSLVITEFKPHKKRQIQSDWIIINAVIRSRNDVSKGTPNIKRYAIINKRFLNTIFVRSVESWYRKYNHQVFGSLLTGNESQSFKGQISEAYHLPGVYYSRSLHILVCNSSLTGHNLTISDHELPGYVKGYVRRFWQVCRIPFLEISSIGLTCPVHRPAKITEGHPKLQDG
jgi:hypothetical protein